MIRVGGGVVVIEVAINAFRREARIHSSGVTRGAREGGVRTDQRPHAVRVGRLIPVGIRRLVAAVTRCREAGRGVIRIYGRVVIRLMAAYAIRRRSGIDAIRVAG